MRGNRLFRFIDVFVGIPLCFILSIYGRIFRRGGGVNRQINSILIVKLSALGDTVLLMPVLRALRRQHPQARIVFVCSSVNRDIVLSCPYVTQTIELEVPKIMKRPGYLIKFIAGLRGNNFDLSIDADQWLRISSLLCFLSGVKQRIGFKTPGQYKHFLFTQAVPHSRDKHEIECFFDLLGSLNIKIKPQDKCLEFPVSDEAMETAKIILGGIGIEEHVPFVILHPEAPAHGKQRALPGKHWAAIIEHIRNKGTHKILLTGTGEAGVQIQKIKEMLNEGIAKEIYVLVDVPVGIFAAVIRRSKLVVCPNTGVMHLACAVGTPVVGLHGPTDSVKWGPYSQRAVSIKSKLPCSPCLYLGYEYKCSRNRCMESIEPQEIFSGIDFCMNL